MANTVKNTTCGPTGSVAWSAPEYLNPERVNERNGKGDVFSFGVIVWELITGNFPWEYEGNALSPLDIVLLVIQGERLDIPDSCNAEIRDIILECWHDGIRNPALELT